MPLQLQPAVFLDRDGTLMEDVDYCNDPAQVRLLAGVPEALQKLQHTGFQNVIITNQSGLARGRISIPQFEAVQARLLSLLGKESIVATYFCPDLPGPYALRRKPSPAMVFEAADDLGLDLARSWFIGDKAIDVQCGRAAGVRPILVLTGYGQTEERSEAEFVAKDFAEAVQFILSHSAPAEPAVRSAAQGKS